MNMISRPTAVARCPDDVAEAVPRRLEICIISPRFPVSFFGMEHALPLMPGDKKSTMMPGALPLLAALVPEGHGVTIIDENVEEIDFDRLRAFDVIGLTGMIVQRARMEEILRDIRDLPAIVCVGGPYVTVDEEQFSGLCDVMFIGEADESWPRFLDSLAKGEPFETRYQQPAATNMASLPVPRFELMATGRYLSAALQFSRGCPFLCEFCDIIVIFGRKPRLKAAEQIIAELEKLVSLGVTHVFFVDDNFIGNKARATLMLRELAEWQAANDYPMTFSTEASVNLGDEDEILDLLWRANFRSVFIGIESPRAESLLETRKTQNVRGPLDEKLERIREAGIIVQGGFIVGFDGDDPLIFDEQFDFIQRNAVGIAIVSILSPIPSTPLHARLGEERRLIDDDDIVWFEPKRMSVEELKDGYRALNVRLFEPANFFARVYDGVRRSDAFRRRHGEREIGRKARPSVKRRLDNARDCLAMARRLVRALSGKRLLAPLGRAYLAAYLRHNAPWHSTRLPLREFLMMCARHWHHYLVAHDTGSFWGRAGFSRKTIA